MPGDIYVFRGRGKGEYAAGVKLMGTDGKPIRAGLASSVSIADWDRDGDLDLIVGNIQGQVMWLANEGKRGDIPVFAAARPLLHDTEGRTTRMNGSTVTTLKADAGPLVVDWDGDGIQDLLVGYSDGSVSFYKAHEERGVTVLASPITLIEPRDFGAGDDVVRVVRNAKTNGFELEVERSQQRAKLAVYDWNGDGLLDLIVGDFVGVNGPEPVLTGEQQAEKAHLAEEQKAVSSEYSRIHARVVHQAESDLGLFGSESADVNKQSTVQARVSELMKTDDELKKISAKIGSVSARLRELSAPWLTHGYVWVYLRKN